MYLINKKVKKKVHDMGYRANKGFLQMLDVAIESILAGTVQWTQPKKLMTRDTLAAYLQSKNIKI